MDEKGLKEAIQKYFDSSNESNAGAMAEVFHESAHLYMVGQDGKLLDWDQEFFINRIKSRKESPAGHVFPVQNEILSIDFTSDDTAVVRLKIRVGDVLYTDILSFIRLDGTWWIISKLATGVPAE